MKKAIVTFAIPLLLLSSVGVAGAHHVSHPKPVFTSSGVIAVQKGQPVTVAVRLIPGAEYLWSVWQDRKVLWSNLIWTGTLSRSARYTLAPGTGAYAALHPGPFQISVRDTTGPHLWSPETKQDLVLRTGAPPAQPTAAPPTDQPTAAPPTDQPTAAPPTDQPTAAPATGDVLYTADLTKLLGGGPEWRISGGMLVNDGSGSNGVEMLPYKTSTSDYAVEAEIRAGTGQYGNPEFGLRVRVNGSAAGYIGSVDGGSAAIKSFDSGYAITNVPFSSGTGWHTYRFECQGNSLRLLVDGMLVADGTDTRYPSGGQVGLYDNYMPLTVRAIRVIALHDQPQDQP